jgi:hypothetical protein
MWSGMRAIRFTPAFAFYDALGALKRGEGGEKMRRAAGEFVCDDGGGGSVVAADFICCVFVAYIQSFLLFIRLQNSFR